MPSAFPLGSHTPGGRGGTVLFVTNLSDYRPGKEPAIPGSLRWACATAGPRTVVFRVSGTLALKQTLTISEPYLTLAGETAPGGGICLRDEEHRRARPASPNAKWPGTAWAVFPRRHWTYPGAPVLLVDDDRRETVCRAGRQSPGLQWGDQEVGAGYATRQEVSVAFDCCDRTVRRHQARYRDGGMAALATRSG